eukprot:10271659-Lingulodinium_polyedra.AAC.1
MGPWVSEPPGGRGAPPPRGIGLWRPIRGPGRRSVGVAACMPRVSARGASCQQASFGASDPGFLARA